MKELSLMKESSCLSPDSCKLLKGIAALSVVISHLPKILPLPGIIDRLLHPFGYLGVAIFLMLSGYGCTISIKNKGRTIEFLYKRICNIVPCLFIITIFTVIGQAILGMSSFSLFLNFAKKLH